MTTLWYRFFWTTIYIYVVVLGNPYFLALFDSKMGPQLCVHFLVATNTVILWKDLRRTFGLLDCRLMVLARYFLIFLASLAFHQSSKSAQC